MPKFMIEAISQYRMLYCIEADTKEEAIEHYETQSDTIEEFGQQWLGETTFSTREVSDEECISIFDDVNSYLKNVDVSRKMEYVTKVKK